LQARLLREAFDQAGFLGPDGKKLKGVSGSVRRYGGRAGQGGYEVKVSRDPRQRDQAQLPKPNVDNG
jgi:hypothetical protein